ncbi:MAG: S9 family peptidase [Proteobacteria bacterium]|nr:S9 family peptidase [Pseudomonadota bacterium]
MHLRFRSAAVRGSLVAAIAAFAALVAGLAAAQQPPVAPVRPVTTDYFGTRVTDDYRYMENLADPEVRAWMRGQADHARAVLDAIPGRRALLERIHALHGSDLRRGGFVRRGERYFYEVREPGAEVSKLYYRDGLQGEEHLLIDPARLAGGTATHYSLDYYEPSWDGRLIAYGVSAGGSEASVLHVLDVQAGTALPDAIDRTSDGVIAWRADNRSFFYLRYPQPTPTMAPSETMYNARTYLHLLGTRPQGDGDPAVFGRGVDPKVDVPEGQGTYVLLAPGSAYAVAVANRNMDDNPSTFYVAPVDRVRDGRAPWRKLADVADGVTRVELRGNTLYFMSRKDALRGRVLATSLAKPDVAHAKVIVPEGKGVLTALAFDRDTLYVRERDGAVSHVKRYAPDGSSGRVLAMPFEGTIGTPVTDPREPGALISLRGWLQSPHIYAYDAARDASTDTGLIPPSKTDLSQLVAEEVEAVSYDGTRIPLSILHQKGIALDGSHPTILDGYGSYGAALEPWFDPTSLAWIERGGVLAVAHVRGGGEYGEAWHRAGQLLTKTNTIFDFIACGEYLVDHRYMSSKRMAAQGGSAGGITVGGAMTWRPELFGVILDEVGASDTLRSETEPNGPPNVPEFGSVQTEEGFHGLYAMSAYAHVRNGTPYPAVLFSTGANDPRVAPWHMAKMAARTQAATSSGRPVLLRVDYDAGHGIGSSASQGEALTADLWSFALWQFGDPAFQP